MPLNSILKTIVFPLLLYCSRWWWISPALPLSNGNKFFSLFLFQGGFLFLHPHRFTSCHCVVVWNKVTMMTMWQRRSARKTFWSIFLCLALSLSPQRWWNNKLDFFSPPLVLEPSARISFIYWAHFKPLTGFLHSNLKQGHKFLYLTSSLFFYTT